MKLSEARAVCADLVWREYDERLYQALQKELLHKLVAVSPKVSALEPGIFLLDASGMNHLGGEEKFCRRVQKLMNLVGFAESHTGIADSAFTALVASKFKKQNYFIVPSGESKEFLSLLSVRHLPSDFQITDTLLSLGIRTMGQLLSLPAEEVIERFGLEGLRAYELAGGNDSRFPESVPFDQEFHSSMELGFPVQSLQQTQFILKSMLTKLCEDLKQGNLQCVALEIAFFNDDEKFDTRTIKLVRPSNSSVFLLELIKLNLESRQLSREFTGVRIQATRFSPEEWNQNKIGVRQSAESTQFEESTGRLLQLTPPHLDGSIEYDLAEKLHESPLFANATQTGEANGDNLLLLNADKATSASLEYSSIQTEEPVVWESSFWSKNSLGISSGSNASGAVSSTEEDLLECSPGTSATCSQSGGQGNVGNNDALLVSDLQQTAARPLSSRSVSSLQMQDIPATPGSLEGEMHESATERQNPAGNTEPAVETNCALVTKPGASSPDLSTETAASKALAGKKSERKSSKTASSEPGKTTRRRKSAEKKTAKSDSTGDKQLEIGAGESSPLLPELATEALCEFAAGQSNVEMPLEGAELDGPAVSLPAVSFNMNGESQFVAETNVDPVESMALLLQRFVSRLGPGSLVRSVPNDQHLPDSSGAWVPIAEDIAPGAVLPIDFTCQDSPPFACGLVLKKSPSPEPVLVEYKGHLPSAVTYQGRWYRIRELTEPEKLSGLWWENPVCKSYYVALIENREKSSSNNRSVRGTAMQSPQECTGLLVLLVRDHSSNSWQIEGFFD